jgi:predicted Ser/Thr protein kinase
LLNVSYKILTKLLADRLGFIHKIIADTQTAFIRNRYIMEGIGILHETIHEIHHKKMSGVLFKIDFEKAYDKVNWAFLYQMMQARGLGDVLCDWIMKVVRGEDVLLK